MTPMRALSALVVTFVLLASPAARGDEPAWPWYEVEPGGKVRVHLYLFYSTRCPHCTQALAFAADLRSRHPWVKVVYYETSANPANLDLYRRKAASLGRVAGQVPAFFYCKTLALGYASYEGTGVHIERAMARWHEALRKHYEKKPATPAAWGAWLLTGVLGEPPGPPPEPAPAPAPDEPPVYVPGWGVADPLTVSLPLLTVILAGCDAFNPCAFFVLLLLLSLLTHGQSRWRLLVVGGVFVFFSGLIYFLFMAAWLNLFLVAGHLPLITAGAGVVALMAAALNIKDFYWFKQGPSLSIPESARPGLFQRMTHLIGQASFVPLLLGTVVLAVTANMYELLCTSGLPMVYTRVLTLRQLPPGAYYLYLALYNLIYVAPLALIVLGFVWALGARKLTEYEGRVLKLMSGMMMLLLGGVLLVRPELLSTVLGAVGSLTLAAAVTAALVAVDRCRMPVPRPGPAPDGPGQGGT